MNGKFISQTLTLELSNSNYFYLIYQINSPDCYFVFRPPPHPFSPEINYGLHFSICQQLLMIHIYKIYGLFYLHHGWLGNDI